MRTRFFNGCAPSDGSVVGLTSSEVLGQSEKASPLQHLPLKGEQDSRRKKLHCEAVPFAKRGRSVFSITRHDGSEVLTVNV